MRRKTKSNFRLDFEGLDWWVAVVSGAYFVFALGMYYFFKFQYYHRLPFANVFVWLLPYIPIDIAILIFLGFGGILFYVPIAWFSVKYKVNKNARLIHYIIGVGLSTGIACLLAMLLHI